MRTTVILLVRLAGCGSRETVEFQRDGQPEHTILPVAFEHALPFIDVVINGHRVPVVFDLGSNGTLWLSPEAAEACGARFTGGTSRSSDAYGNVFVARDFVLDEVMLGEYRLTGVGGREFHGAQDGFEVQGILGLGALEHFHIVLDWPANQLLLATGRPPATFATVGWTTLPFDWTSYGIRAPVEVNGRRLSMIWDSGASVSNLKPGRTDAPLQRRGDRDFLMASDVRIGGTEVGPLAFAVMDLKDPPGDGILGSNFFLKHRVMIDLKAETLAFR
jgi:hypothetical protein